MIKMFEIPAYTIRASWLGELHGSTTELYLSNFMKAKGIESVALELRQGRLCAHVEQVVSSEGM
jgi:hypothetical protein